MTIKSRMLNGLSAQLSDTDENEAKKAKIENYGILSAKVDKELLEHATELARLIAVGGISCRELDEYNQLALSVYKANFRVFSELLRAGADRSALLSPFQPAFFTVDPGGVSLPIECETDGENCNATTVLSPCPGGAISQGVVINASSKYSEVFEPLQPARPVASALDESTLSGLGLAVAPAILWGLAILTAGTAAIILTPKVLGFFDGSSADIATSELTAARSKLATASFKARRECIEFGGTASECTRSTRDAFAAPVATPGFLNSIVVTSFKLGGMFIVGSFLYKKIQER